MARVGIAEAAARVGEHRRGRFARAALGRALDDLHQARSALTRAATRLQAERARAWITAERARVADCRPGWLRPIADPRLPLGGRNGGGAPPHEAAGGSPSCRWPGCADP